MFSKQDLWPKEGKLKKGLIILGIVILCAVAITLLEEKTQFKAGKKLPLIIAFSCLGVWVYKPGKNNQTTTPSTDNIKDADKFWRY
jgi:hypothetical protein